MKNKHIVKYYLFLLVLLCIIGGLVFFVGKEKREKKITVTIALMQDPWVENYETNLYTKWLEEKTGYNIDFVYFTEGYEAEYLNAMLIPENGTVDAVFLQDDSTVLSAEIFDEYCNAGYICDISQFVTENSNIYALKNQVATGDGEIYYAPNIRAGKKYENAQITWINFEWLKKLSLQIPETTDDLREVLIAFKDLDPNRNGKADELPMITNNVDSSFQSELFLSNAFGDNSETYWEYRNYLYNENLLSLTCGGFSRKQLQELINSPDDVIGVFCSRSILDLVYPSSTDVISRYVAVPPLTGPDGEKRATKSIPAISIGGYIPANAEHKQEAVEIMDLMLSTEGSIFAAYGEENIDWRNSKPGEKSAYGEKAIISVINDSFYGVQNKHFRGAGPSNLPARYVDNVFWSESSAYAQYVDARAIRLYEEYYD